jgi:AcrR family transcriptional regulator
MPASRPELPREFVAAHKRRRMMDAMAELCAEKGYEATRIADVVRRAKVARKTLYDNYAGKEELFLACFDTTVAEAEAAVDAVCDAAGPADGTAWGARMEAGLEAFLDFVAVHPDAARLCVVDAPGAFAAAAARYDAAIDSFVARLRDSAPAGGERPATLEEALIGGLAWIVHQQIRGPGGIAAGDLLPQLREFLLTPYQGVAKG